MTPAECGNKLAVGLTVITKTLAKIGNLLYAQLTFEHQFKRLLKNMKYKTKENKK